MDTEQDLRYLRRNPTQAIVKAVGQSRDECFRNEFVGQGSSSQRFREAWGWKTR